MCRLNYTFILVNDHFMVHPGIKRYSGMARKRYKKTAQIMFQSAIKKFRQRMDMCCPETKKLCPKF